MPPYELWRTLRVKKHEDGKSLLTLLCTRFPFIQETVWKQRIESGWLQRNGQPLSTKIALHKGDEIRHYSPRVVEPSVPDSLTVLEETSDWLFIYKPAPMPMHAGGRYVKNTALHVLYEMGYRDVRTVHRLDAVTSGLVLLARSKEIAAQLRTEFDAGRVTKIYRAVVSGCVRESVTVSLPIRRKQGFVFECGDALAGAKEAATIIRPVRYLSEENATLVECEPLTGRTHQLRLHLEACGHPIVDDPIYGPHGDKSGKRIQNSAISLQSSGLEIKEMGIRKFLKAYPKYYHHYW
ncbi:MAG: pseudouridine synthase [Balneolaceae bacterium]